MPRPFLVLGLIALVLAAVSGTPRSAAAQTPITTFLAVGAQDVEFDYFNACKRLTNNYDTPVMVPTLTEPEWRSFYEYPPPGVALRDCPALTLVFTFALTQSGQPRASEEIDLSKVVHPAPGEQLRIDWGDGTTADRLRLKHTYVRPAGSYVVRVLGEIEQFGEKMTVLRDSGGNILRDDTGDPIELCKIDNTGSNRTATEWGEDVFFLTEIRSFGEELSRISCVFGSLWYKFSYLGQTPVPVEVTSILPPSVTNLDFAFADYSIGVRTYQKDGVTKRLFQDIENWDTSNVTSMEGLFRFEVVQPTSPAEEQAIIDGSSRWGWGFDCRLLGVGTVAADSLDLSGWDVSNVTNMREMFKNNRCFNADLSGWDVSNVTDMSGMFFGAASFTADISGWQTDSLRAMDRMFYNAYKFDRPIGGWDVSGVTSMVEVFRDAQLFNQDLSGWDVSNVTTMRGLFDGLNRNFFQDSAYRTRFNTDISGWDISNVTDMSNMFRANGSFNRDITGWDVSNVTDMSGMFAEAIAFNQPIGVWDVSNVTDMSDMFANARAFNQPLGAWDVSNVTDMSGMFDSWLAEAIGPSTPYWGAVPFNQDLSSWDVGNVTDMSRMFRWGRFTQPINMWDTSNVTDMSRMFERHETYNQPLNGLDVSKVTTMRRMFAEAKLFNQPLDQWDVGNVRDVTRMFQLATAFNGTIGNWNLRPVVGDQMFDRASVFNQPLTGWDVSQMTTAVEMFKEATAFNGDVSNWNTASLRDATGMFQRASSFNQPLAGWSTASLVQAGNMFNGARVFNQDLNTWFPYSPGREIWPDLELSRMFERASAFKGNISAWYVGRARVNWILERTAHSAARTSFAHWCDGDTSTYIYSAPGAANPRNKVFPCFER
ncbi:MAG: BspA family leucine-rich repeat surface protein [Gemmobacter sp.]